MNNFLPLDRKILDHWVWEDKPFRKGQAWVDLLLLANYKDKKNPVKDTVITYKRGSVNLSMVQLADRWGWDRRKVKRFLDVLSDDGMVSVNSTTYGTTITIVNYEFFNNSCTTNSTCNGTTDGTTYSTTDSTTDCTTNAQPMVQQVRTTNKDNKDKENKDIHNVQKELKKADANALFEKLWKLYPVKKGKGQVSDTAKIRLLKIGEEELLRAIDRYKTELEKDSDWRKPQNGSTFFNSGYVDYLDENYVPGKREKPKSRNSFNNFQQNDYDFAALEKELENL